MFILCLTHCLARLCLYTEDHILQLQSAYAERFYAPVRLSLNLFPLFMGIQMSAHMHLLFFSILPSVAVIAPQRVFTPRVGILVVFADKHRLCSHSVYIKTSNSAARSSYLHVNEHEVPNCNFLAGRQLPGKQAALSLAKERTTFINIYNI